MNATSEAVEVGLQSSEGSSRGDTLVARLRLRGRMVRQGWLQVFGIPDYERYLAHRAAHHPEDALLSRRDFFAQAIDRKYSRSGPRCC